MNKQVVYIGDKVWNGVIDGCLSQVPYYESQINKVVARPQGKPQLKEREEQKTKEIEY